MAHIYQKSLIDRINAPVRHVNIIHHPVFLTFLVLNSFWNIQLICWQYCILLLFL